MRCPGQIPAKFAERAARLALADLAAAAQADGVTLFDRGVIDAVCAFERMGVALPEAIAGAFARCRYARTVFLAPPWPELFRTDIERRHGFEAATAEYAHLARRLPELGYRPVLLPRAPVEARADFVAARLAEIRR